MSKKKILFVGEASFLATGFSVYGHNVIKRLHETGKYEIAEMGNYGASNSPEAQKLPWRFYGSLPLNEEEDRIYKSKPINQFGEYKFDAVVNDFQPDIVFSWLDPWMFQHIPRSRFRNNFKIVLMPTVDSAPQKKEWIEEVFKKADYLTTYSDYGKRTLEAEGLRVYDFTSPGADIDVFKPQDKFKLREDWGLNKKLLVIGTVMRNQKRKLFPELFNSYAELRRKYRGVPEVERSVLLCHTSWPDVGWDIPELVYRAGIQRHVLFTYHCNACKKTFFSWFIPNNKAGMSQCIFCGQHAARMPNTHHGVSREELAEIMNMMDIYIHPAICEGWGMPIVEAKACGLPVLCTNYSAMEDHIKNGGALPIEVDRFYTEAETMAIRALVDNKDIVEKLHHLLTHSKERRKLGEEARQCVLNMHTWENTVGKLENLFDSIEPQDRAKTWGIQPAFKVLSRVAPPANLTNEQFVLFCYREILGREPDEPGFHNWMVALSNNTPRESIIEFFRNEIETQNRFEQIRQQNYLSHNGLEPHSIELTSDALPGVVV